MTYNNKYWNHFTRKVPHEDYKEVKVSETPGGRYVEVNENHTKPEWKKLTKPTLVNATLANQNKRHLQQTSYEAGINTKHPFTTQRVNAGFNEMATKAKTESK